jgi:hypothetical protein
MPLRDHFHPPLANRRRWDFVHGGWPMTIAAGLNRTLPARYTAGPQVHLGSVEIDVATYEGGEANVPAAVREEGGGVATAVWAPPRPTLSVATDSPDVDEYEVRVHDEESGHLVAAVEIVSPSNKDRPEHRRAFAAKCAVLLQAGVCVAIVDVVTARTANLYGEMLGLLGQADPALAGGPVPLYAVACRWAPGPAGGPWRIETWLYPLEVGEPLPTLPLWIAGDLAVPLDLEASYEETCRALRLV